MRRRGRDVVSFVLPLTLPLALSAFYLCGAVGFKASPTAERRRPFAAFVELSPKDEVRATQAVKAAWQGDAGGIKRLRTDLSVGELPEETPGPVLEFSLDALRMPQTEVSFDLPPLPPSIRADAPRKLEPAPAAESVPQTFSKEELLKID